MQDNKNQWLIYLAALIIVAFLPISFLEIANALSNNYNKTSGGQLTTSDWNNLPADFLARTGGPTSAMQGALDMGNNRVTNLAAPTADSDAVTRGAMNAAIAAVGDNIRDVNGNSLRMVCGNTVPGATNWETYLPDPHSVRIDRVDTSAAGFTTTPYYIVYLRGSFTYVTIGFNNIYNPQPDSFRVYAVYLGENNDYLTPSGTFITPAQANAWQWTVYWCAIGR